VLLVEREGARGDVVGEGVAGGEQLGDARRRRLVLLRHGCAGRGRRLGRGGGALAGGGRAGQRDGERGAVDDAAAEPVAGVSECARGRAAAHTHMTALLAALGRLKVTVAARGCAASCSSTASTSPTKAK
jgi:hypothetical protein